MFHLRFFSMASTLFCLTSCAFETSCNLNKMNVTSFRNCDFQNSGITSVSERRISPKCQSVSFAGNRLTVMEDFAFVSVTGLLQLDLSRNQIYKLEPEAFAGLGDLLCLDLSRNTLHLTYESFPRIVFAPLTRLKALNIGGNAGPRVEAFPDESIKSLVSLEVLEMDMFTDMEMGLGFSDLKNLEVLIGGTRSDIETISSSFFVSFENLTITKLILFDCGIQEIEPSAFRYFPYLEQFSLARNHRIGLPSAMATLQDLVDSPLHIVNFAHVNSGFVRITEQTITADMMRNLEPFCVQNLDLSNNLVVHFELEALYRINRTCLEVLRLEHTFLLASVWLSMSVISLRFQNLRVLSIAGSVINEVSYPEERGENSGTGERQTHCLPSPESSSGIVLYIHPKLSLLNISRSYLNCNIDGKVIEIRHALVLKTVDLSYSSATNCFHRPIKGVENVKTLSISGNDYSDTLNADFLSSFPKLTSLEASDVSLVNIFQTQKKLLNELKLLQHLNIANSDLTSVPSTLLASQQDLRTLDVSQNRLTAVPDVVYSLRNLETLDLSYNAIVAIPREDRQSLESRGKLRLWLSGNPFACNCETYDFVEWIWTSNLTFDNADKYSCVLSNGSEVPMVSLREGFRDLQVACVSSFWVIFSAVGTSLIFITLVFVAIAYRYRVPIKYWFHTLCQKQAARPSQRHKYDALVAYCHQDSDWVCDTLYPALTNKDDGNVYKLCFYDRDFLPGVPIEESIIAAINKSFKIILVITPAFMESTWCRFEMQMVRMKMIQVGRVDIVIPIILQDVPVSSMPKSLLNLWNTSVFLMWSESPGAQRHFWENLLAALGPPRVEQQTQACPDHGADGDEDDHCLLP